MLDAAGNTVFLNQAAEQLFEVSQKLVAGQSFARLFVDGSAVLRLCADASIGAFDERRSEITLERLENAEGASIDVAPGNGHRVWMPLPVELPGALLARFV